MLKYSLPITKPISPSWASRRIFLQNLHARRYDDCTICWAGEAYAKLLDWDRPAPNASLFDYDDGVPKQCTIDAGKYAAKAVDDLRISVVPSTK